MDSRFSHAIRIARAAGNTAMGFYRNRGGGLQIEQKGGHDWVSEADRQTEDDLRQRIAEAFPGDRLIGEESGDTGAHPGNTNAVCWVLDPIDGTTCFLSGIPQWCIAIAIGTLEETTAAVIYDPVHDELFSAAKGQGAWLNDQPLRLAPGGGIGDGLLSVGSHPPSGADRAGRYMQQLLDDGGMYTRIGSCALALAYVAAGRLVGMVEPRVHPWDSWAGSLVVREAGGRATAHRDGAQVGRPGPVMAATPTAWEHLDRHY